MPPKRRKRKLRPHAAFTVPGRRGLPAPACGIRAGARSGSKQSGDPSSSGLCRGVLHDGVHQLRVDSSCLLHAWRSSER